MARADTDLDPINLAHVAPFRLGAVEVHPATRQLIRGERTETVEPRVMQVLVALAEAKGAVLTRDELIDRCWGGRIVSENAINRVISRIRQLSADFGMASFQLETITKVGYRMVVLRKDGVSPDPSAAPLRHETAPAEAIARPLVSRRQLIAAGAGVAVMGAVGAWSIWGRRREHQPSAEVLELFRRGEAAQREGVPDQVRQAVSFFEQAVAADPLFARGWGALALSYRHILEGFAEAEKESLPGRIQSAASRALSLDPGNADAQLALLILKPYYRNWAPMESGLKRLVDKHPDHWLAQAQLGLLLQDVGRLDEGIGHSEKVIAIDPYLPVAYGFLARGLSCAGRVQEADAVLDRALQRFPSHPMIWSVRYNVLLYSGRPGSAAAFVMDPERRPEAIGPDAVPIRLTLARAVEERRPEDIEASVATYRKMALEDVDSIPNAATVFALLERPDLAFSSLERYYLGTGPFGDPIPPPGPYDRRYTIPFFSPPMRRYREDRRYKSLLERVGLERYWQATKSRPDYRRDA